MQESPEHAEDVLLSKLEWAERRTDWAEDRTILASERTFAGWMRTALTAIAVALGLQALFSGFEPDWVVKIVASLFVIAATFMIWTAQRAAARTARRMDHHEVRVLSRGRLTIIAVLVSLAALATGGILWML